MAINSELREFLLSKEVSYEELEHPKVFSTIDEARALDIDGDEIAKSLVVHVTHLGNNALIVIPGAQKTSNQKLHQLFGTKHARLASETEMAELFPQFELGAVPPLGSFLHIPSYVDRRLVEHETVLFNGGTHTASIKMSVHDFLNLSDASIVDVVEERMVA